MLKRNRKKKKWRRVLVITILAICCIGGAELMVCRTVDPALYEKIMTPVRKYWGEFSESASQVLHTVSDTVSNTAHGLIEKISSVVSSLSESEPEEPPENQAASEPIIEEELIVADPAVTELITRDGQNILTGGSVEITYYQQSAPEWADKRYGRDNIGQYGCGPTTMAMAVSSLTERKINPEEMADWAADHGYWVSRSGSSHSIVKGTANAFGLEATPLRVFEKDTLLQQLASGKLIVALVVKGHFTNSGHFILLRGATLDGNILVADPNSPDRSLVEWDPEIILSELSPSRDSGAPLWALSILS